MAIQLLELDDQLVDEHIFERYIELGARSEHLKQDLGIVDTVAKCFAIDIEPPATGKRRKKAKDPDAGLQDRYYLEISQSITSLHSSRDNDNSTTGFVLWSTTPFFLRWLLYDPEANTFRNGGSIGDIVVPPLLNSSTAIVELGAGTSGILPVVLGNYVATYVCTDQRGLINSMKANINQNLCHLNRRRCVSKSLGIKGPLTDDDTKASVNLETMPLDWEKFQISTQNAPFELKLAANCSTVYIIAMDVIYNDYLIDPFLKTLSQLLKYFQDQSINTHCLIGIHMRAQEVVSDFLNKAVLDYNLPIHYIQSEAIEASRFSIYYI